MKNKYQIIIAILIAAAVFGACKKEESTSPFLGIENLSKDASYSMGMSIAIEGSGNRYAFTTVPVG